MSANKNKLLALGAFLLLSLTLPTHAVSRQDIQQMRTLSYSVINNVLVYHNPNGTPFDPSNAENYQRDLQRLLQLSTQLHLPEINARTMQLEAAIANLRHLPQSTSSTRDKLPPYSSWFPQILDQQSQLNTLLSELYVSQPPANELQQELHSLSQDIQRLSLAYQLESFTYLVSHQWMLDQQTVIELDASVQRRFAELAARDPDLGTALDKLPVRYHFVRGYLLKPGGWAPSAVERYLMSTTQDLDKAAATVTP